MRSSYFAATVSPVLLPQGAALREDAELVQLGRSICRAVRDVLERSREVTHAIRGGEHPGDDYFLIDRLCNVAAGGIAQAWSRQQGTRIALIGEDLNLANPMLDEHEIVVCIDALDGTEHWRRDRNLYATALSVFRRSDDHQRYSLRCSVVMDADYRTFWACESDPHGYFANRNGPPLPLSLRRNVAATLGDAHVCTVARRAVQYGVLIRHLSHNPFPFRGLYTFGGNPILAALALGHYDAVFQLRREDPSDIAKIWDWLPGLHIALRGDCHVATSVEGLDLIKHGEDIVSGTAAPLDFAFAVAPARPLVEELQRWMW